MGLKIPRSTTLAPPSPRLAVGTAQHRSFPRSLVHPPTSTPKPRAEGRVRAGGTQATSRPERERRPSPSAPAKNREASTMLASLFFVSAHKDSATRHGCAPRSACRGASACQWHANYEPTEAAGETSPMSIYACFPIRPHPLHLPPAPRTHPVSPFSG